MLFNDTLSGMLRKMLKRTKVEMLVALFLIIIGSITLILPLFNYTNVKNIFICIIGLYGIVHLIKYFTTIETKDYSGIITAFSCLVTLFIMLFININDSPWNLALVLFIWIIMMSLNKLKESDYYHDRNNKLWILNISNLILFILIGLLTTINLYYTNDVQILVIGFFFLSHGILEFMDPLVAYIISKK